ncbi:MAG: hypothetical protein QOE98_1857, partial [Gaiellaceae bacterium]|nr:hypothetical protein [Gaiellaceae bacterium]
EPGDIAVDDAVSLERSPVGGLPVLDLQDLFYDKKASPATIEQALRSPIDIRSRRSLERRLARHV